MKILLKRMDEYGELTFSSGSPDTLVVLEDAGHRRTYRIVLTADGPFLAIADVEEAKTD
jgi:hypothetical protein